MQLEPGTTHLGKHVVASATGYCVPNCPACAHADYTLYMLVTVGILGGIGILVGQINAYPHGCGFSWGLILRALGVFGLFCLLAQVWDWWVWNRGYCRQCGNRLRQFDTDSQGGRGYVCINRHHVWVSWPWTDNEYVHEEDKPWNTPFPGGAVQWIWKDGRWVPALGKPPKRRRRRS